MNLRIFRNHHFIYQLECPVESPILAYEYFIIYLYTKFTSTYVYLRSNSKNPINSHCSHCHLRKKWVDNGMNTGDSSFINGASGIVNRGCHNPPNCGTGELHAGVTSAAGGVGGSQVSHCFIALLALLDGNTMWMIWYIYIYCIYIYINMYVYIYISYYMTKLIWYLDGWQVMTCICFPDMKPRFSCGKANAINLPHIGCV
jgi:hypothetical protein